MSKRFWSTSEVAYLRKLAKTHTLHEAANLLGRGYRATAYKAGMQGIRFQKYGEAHHAARIPKANILQVLVLREQGVSTRIIAERIGACPNYVNRIKRFGARYRETLPALLAKAKEPDEAPHGYFAGTGALAYVPDAKEADE